MKFQVGGRCDSRVAALSIVRVPISLLSTSGRNPSSLRAPRLSSRRPDSLSASRDRDTGRQAKAAKYVWSNLGSMVGPRGLVLRLKANEVTGRQDPEATQGRTLFVYCTWYILYQNDQPYSMPVRRYCNHPTVPAPRYCNDLHRTLARDASPPDPTLLVQLGTERGNDGV